MKLTSSEITPVERETATIRNYPFPTKVFSITNIRVNGRDPVDTTKQHVEHELSFVCYIVSGSGKFIVEGEISPVVQGDAVYIQPNQIYYIGGQLEYLVCCSPAYYREQHEQVPD